MNRCNPDSLRLYLVTDHTLSLGRSTIEIVRQAIAGRVSAIQLRNKGQTFEELVDTGRQIKELISVSKFPPIFLVNDRVDLALALDCDGIHLGQSDMSVLEARKLLGPDKIIGLSVNCLEQVDPVIAATVDYIAANGVFATATKNDLGTPLGLEFVRVLRTRLTRPLVGIGGIKPDNAAEVIAAGCDGIAVVTAITQATDILEACRRLWQAIERGLAYSIH
ncbi:thiamine phosphate synthase [bacterium]|nr:thiamine phosphate synthase [bacterium]